MPRRTDLRRILVLGAGPIVIGQGCEFDYSGTQGIRALVSEGYEVILINSNPATIMTDPELAHRTYVEPLDLRAAKAIIEKERPDAILPTLGGQTALNLALELHEDGILQALGIELLGARPDSIRKAEDRALFKEAMDRIGLQCPRATVARSIEHARETAKELGFPLILRPSFTLGGAGGGIVRSTIELDAKVAIALAESPTHEVLVEESLLGWKEFELEVIRDQSDNFIVVCTIENLDPLGVHTGDSITVAPAMTLTDKEFQRLRDAARSIMSEIGVTTGGANVQFAVRPEDGSVRVIEMNPRVSRSSALASKATGYPIAKVATRLAVGYRLDELTNDLTGTSAAFEPTLDYVVVKWPRFAFDKFPEADQALGTQMKSVGETMAIGRTFVEAVQKAARGLETGLHGLSFIAPTAAGATQANTSDQTVAMESRPRSAQPSGDTAGRAIAAAARPSDRRLLHLVDALRLGASQHAIAQDTSIDLWFIAQLQRIVDAERAAAAGGKRGLTDKDKLTAFKRLGLSDARLAELVGVSEHDVRKLRSAMNVRPTFLRVDTCAAEMPGTTPYLYATWETASDDVGSGSDDPSSLRRSPDAATSPAIPANAPPSATLPPSRRPPIPSSERTLRSAKPAAHEGTLPAAPHYTPSQTATPHSPSERTLHKATPPPPSERTLQAATPHSPSERTLQAATPHAPSERTLQAATPHSPSERTLQAATPHSPSERTLQAATPHSPSERTLQAATPHAHSESSLRAVTSHAPSERSLQAATSPTTAGQTLLDPHEPSGTGEAQTRGLRPSGRIVVLGAGPNRIGQGIEFDYCCVHAVMAARELGFEAIMVNSNPETVSTDYDIADRLYFEPINLESVLAICDVESPDGLLVQMGGQTPLKLAKALAQNGIKLLGTSADAIDRAEDRGRFDAVLEKLGLSRPASTVVTYSGSTNSREGVHAAAKALGWPVLVRPSYVLGGRAMKIARNAHELDAHLDRMPIESAEGSVILVDRFLDDAIEIDVDCVSDGQRVVIGAVMEHLERAGVHSGDSATILPPFSLRADVVLEIERIVRVIALELGVVGLMNAQLAVKDGRVFVLEVNPRASRTVPFVSKATGVPLARIATKVMLGKTLDELGIDDPPLARHVAAKECVFPFRKLPGADTVLGPEMRSTGEVMGIGETTARAYGKALRGIGVDLRLPNADETLSAFLAVSTPDLADAYEIARRLRALGYRISADVETARKLNASRMPATSLTIQEAIAELKGGTINLAIITAQGDDETARTKPLRTAALARRVPCFTTTALAKAGCSALEEDNSTERVRPLQEWYDWTGQSTHH